METKIVRDVAPRRPRSQSAGLCVHLFEGIKLAIIGAAVGGFLVAMSALAPPARAAETCAQNPFDPMTILAGILTIAGAWVVIIAIALGVMLALTRGRK